MAIRYHYCDKSAAVNFVPGIQLVDWLAFS
jgi:hypothetical protein